MNGASHLFVSMAGDMGFNMEKQDMLLNYVILPRFLPQEKPEHFHGIELQLIAQVVQSVTKLSGILPSKTIELFQRLGRVHHMVVPNVDEITSQINALRSGDTFAMFVRRQNCAFIIYVPPNDTEHVIVANFPGNLHPEEVYKYDSDIEVIYSRVEINKSNCNRLLRIIFIIFQHSDELSGSSNQSQVFKDASFNRFR